MFCRAERTRLGIIVETESSCQMPFLAGALCLFGKELDDPVLIAWLLPDNFFKSGAESFFYKPNTGKSAGD